MERSYLGKRGYILRKSFFTKKQIDEVKGELTVKPHVPDDFGGPPEEPFPIYLENDKKLYIPKFYGIEKFGMPIENQMTPGEDINLEFNLQLKNEQMIPAEETMKAYRGRGGGILSLPCGFGKTILACYFITQIRKKTLVIVHKEFLMNQWIERIRFAIPNAKIGIVQGDKCQIDGNDIIIGMLQTLSMKDYGLNTFDSIGHVIIDECHCIPSRVFSRALLKINSPYMLGLSATPNRKDGLTKVLKYYIGNIVYMVKSSDRNVVKVNRYCFESEFAGYNGEALNYMGKVQMPTMINNICSYMRRTRYIMMKIVEILRENRERQILILSDRKGHLEDFYNLATEMGVESVGYYIGGMKESKLKESEKCRLLLGTYPMASTGLDIPTLNAIVLASPRSDIIQSIGRIDRKKHENIQPIIMDCVDQFSIFESQARKRLDVYRKKFYEVEDFHIEIDNPEYPVVHNKKYQYHTKKPRDEDEEEIDITCTRDNDDEQQTMSQTTISSFFEDHEGSEPITIELPKKKTKATSKVDTSIVGKRPPPNKIKSKPTKPVKPETEKEIAKRLLNDSKAFLFSD